MTNDALAEEVAQLRKEVRRLTLSLQILAVTTRSVFRDHSEFEHQADQETAEQERQEGQQHDESPRGRRRR